MALSILRMQTGLLKYQIPSSAINGNWYVNFTDWEDQPSAAVYRFHWGRLAINPHDTTGQIMPPSMVPTFCPGGTQNTCPLAMLMPDMFPSATNPFNVSATVTPSINVASNQTVNLNVSVTPNITTAGQLIVRVQDPNQNILSSQVIGSTYQHVLYSKSSNDSFHHLYYAVECIPWCL